MRKWLKLLLFFGGIVPFLSQASNQSQQRVLVSPVVYGGNNSLRVITDSFGVMSYSSDTYKTFLDRIREREGYK